jgi:hypothetical protein
MLRFPARWCLWVVAAWLPAQEPSPLPSSPPVALLRLECDGPAAWRTKFAPTNFGVMLASEAGGALWRPRLQHLEAMLGRWLAVGATNTAATPARQRWLDFAGRIELVVWMLVAEGERAAARPQVAVRLHGDGRADLDAMATDLRAMWAAAADLAWHEDPIDDPVWQALPLHSWQVSAPRRTGNTVLFCLGDAGDFAATERFAAALPAPVPAPDAACLRLVLSPRAAEHAMAAADPALARSWRALGWSALHEVEFRIGTAGPQVLFEVGARFQGDERGLFAALFPAAAHLPPLLHLRPADGTPWQLGHFDWAALHRASHASEDAYQGDRAGTSRAAAERESGVDLEADLLAHLHTDYLLLGMPGYSPTEGFDLTTCLVLRTRDDAKVAAGLARLFGREPVLFETTRTTEHDGVKITSYPDFYEPLSIAVGRGLCIVAVGDDAPERVIAVLDRSKTKASEAPPADWLPTLRHAPPGTNGLGAADLHELLTRQLPMLSGIVAFLPTELTSFLPLDDLEAIAEQVAPLLDRFGLRRLRTITGYHDGRWAFRAVW